MVAKRKSVSKLSSATQTSKAAKVAVKDDVEEEVEDQIVLVEETTELTEKEVVAARTKELQSTKMDDLKEMLTSNGLATGKKEAMIKALLKHESKMRVVARDQKAKVRAVVVKKKQELEGNSPAELGKLCDAAGIKGLRSKEERVQRLLIHWQENNGVDKALLQMAEEERTQELQAMDNTQLQKLCSKLGVDPFVTEIMVDRISKKENEKGCYSRPALPQDEALQTQQSGDMVEALLANEAQRKKENELKAQQMDKLAQKRKELKSMSIEDLKKRLAKKGLESSGKKEDLVEALFLAAVQEDGATMRQTELKAKSLQELKELLSRHGLETGSKEQMIKTLLSHEGKCRENLKAFEAKIGEAVEQKKAEFDSKSNAALKEMCGSKRLAVGGGKDDRIERLVEEAKKDGDLDKVVSMNLRNKRKQELMAMDKSAVVSLCEKTGVDPVVKDVMVERVLSLEGEGGPALAMTNAEAPPAKKARPSKK